MKKNSKILLVSLLLFNIFTFQVLSAQFLKGNGNVTESERNVSGILSVEVEDGIDLYISQGNKETIKIVADQNLHQYIKTETDGDNLRIYLSKMVRKAKTLKVYLSVKDIKGIGVSGGSDLYTESTLKSNTLSVICSGGGDAKIDVDVNKLKFKASGGSDGYIKGSAKNLQAKATGGSDIHASDLVAGDCHIEVTGGSDAKINVSGELYVKASGGSDVSYKGKPTHVDANTSGGSDLRHNSF
jgi:hypothetical protein